MRADCIMPDFIDTDFCQDNRSKGTERNAFTEGKCGIKSVFPLVYFTGL